MSDGDSAIPQNGDLTGILLGDLQVLQRLGRGGMADVYKAKQLSLGRMVAIKVLRPGLADESSFGSYVERFKIEARAAAQLNHPNIIQVYEVSQKGGLHYISQEYIDGLNLKQQIDRDGPLPVQLAIDVLHAVLTALDQAAQAGITHRDIKPENIMLSRRGEVKVADFGLARITQPEIKSNLTQIGLTVGTPLYMSPEQIQGAKVDPRSDLYSLGVTMFHVLTGKAPFEGESPLAIAVKHLHEKPPSLTQLRAERLGRNDLPRWLTDIVLRLMAKRPEDRGDSPAKVIDEIHRQTGASRGTIGANYDSSPVNRLQQLMRRERGYRSRWPVAIMLMLVCAALGGSAMSLRPAPAMQRDLADRPGETREEATVEEQFFTALRLDTPEAWEAVWQYFPPSESPLNKLYATKARLQLGRYFYDVKKFSASIEAVLSVAEDPSSRVIYRVLAEARRSMSLRQLGRDAEAIRVQESAQKLAAQVDEDDREILRRLLPDEMLLRLLPTP